MECVEMKSFEILDNGNKKDEKALPQDNSLAEWSFAFFSYYFLNVTLSASFLQEKFQWNPAKTMSLNWVAWALGLFYNLDSGCRIFPLFFLRFLLDFSNLLEPTHKLIGLWSDWYVSIFQFIK